MKSDELNMNLSSELELEFAKIWISVVNGIKLNICEF